MKLPEKFRIYFWDVYWEDVKHCPNSYEKFIISRIADKGNVDSVKWLRKHFSDDFIRDTVIKSRSVSAKTKNFWLHWKTNV